MGKRPKWPFTATYPGSPGTLGWPGSQTKALSAYIVSYTIKKVN